MWAVLVAVGLVGQVALAQDCFCSGVTSECSDATNYYWATLRMEATPEGPGPFTLTDKEQGEEQMVEFLEDTRYLALPLLS